MKRMRIWLRYVAIAAAVACTLVVAIGLHAWRQLNEPLSLATDGEWLEIVPGTSLGAVARQLAARGILESPRILSYYGRLRGDATRIKAGEYLLIPSLTARDLLSRIVDGQVFLHQLTVIEGWRFDDLRKALRDHPAIVATGLEAGTIMAEIGAPGMHPEGQFAPDTYFFPRGTTDLVILVQAHERMQAQLGVVWDERSPTAAVTTPYEALILASIIEKETALPSERRQISGVFSRRLQRGMRLQTDPTVIYGLGDDFDGNLRRVDLGRDTPYNTYTRAGLPPTPIALPGIESLRAAVDPDDGQALYFVASGSADGSHVFSATLEEHNRAVAAYLRRLRNAGDE